jgi:hypothetical protein
MLKNKINIKKKVIIFMIISCIVLACNLFISFILAHFNIKMHNGAILFGIMYTSTMISLLCIVLSLLVLLFLWISKKFRRA